MGGLSMRAPQTGGDYDCDIEGTFTMDDVGDMSHSQGAHQARPRPALAAQARRRALPRGPVLCSVQRGRGRHCASSDSIL